MGPTCPILVDGLNTTRQQFRPVGIAQAQGERSCIVRATSGDPFWMGRKMSKDWLDEAIVCWDGTVLYCGLARSASAAARSAVRCKAIVSQNSKNTNTNDSKSIGFGRLDTATRE